ncbi:glycerate kinase [Cereibacter azotoformans]|uniref:Hydroxypyruvate reductase n=1 Tax=Cereibacter azotoformans TaxID=43057 RepID=A0A2T5K6D7_9RHOB|nr:glycerate kinase [Cereibacter azotoformans]AXQ95819.1 glycerate kinase [Cereibacter sphaeroides]PTR17939.1 hydroxypyruvate reductase [Cereibacter azotoformans]UIJ32670.1 glycerate kinase [Cereibacter azotoformans]
MTDWTDATAAAFLRGLFARAVEASQPGARIPPLLPPAPAGRILVLGAGKAAVGMARAVEEHYADFPRLSGLVITRHGQGGDGSLRRIALREAAHPVPDAAGIAATAELLALTEGLGPDDLVIAVISGGASALMVAPIAGLALEDKVELNRALLASGATIAEMNCLRRHLSRVKGGRLAATCAPARVVALLVSDVPGDDPTVIASGPCHADPTTVEDAKAVLRRLGLDLPRIAAALDAEGAESVKPGDPRLDRVESHIVCSPQMALEAAAEAARAEGLAVHVLGDALEGEAREAGRVLAGIARQIVLRNQPFARPCLLLSGGETTVSIRGPAGIGGRNVEFLLAYLLTARDLPGWALAADTDGVDGAAEVAGAVGGAALLRAARAAGLDPAEALAGHDAHSFFAALGAQVVTGPTGTNVNDFRAILLP